jgi:hypothetical protein
MNPTAPRPRRFYAARFVYRDAGVCEWAGETMWASRTLREARKEALAILRAHYPGWQLASVYREVRA